MVLPERGVIIMMQEVLQIDEVGRECTQCRVYKKWDAFNKSSSPSAPNHKQSRCRACQSLARKEKKQLEDEANGITSEGRQCTKCLTWKPWVDFPLRKAKKQQYPRICTDCSKKAACECTKRSTDVLKETDWCTWQARVLRSRWLKRFKDTHPNKDTSEVPTTEDIRKWLTSFDEFICYYSGEKLKKDSLNFDHIQPVKRNGSFSLSNIAITSPEINKIKGEMNEKEFRQLLQLMSGWEDSGKYLKGMLKRATMVFTKRKR